MREEKNTKLGSSNKYEHFLPSLFAASERAARVCTSLLLSLDNSKCFVGIIILCMYYNILNWASQLDRKLNF